MTRGTSGRGRIFLNDEPVAVDTTSAYRLELENLSAAIRGEAAPLLGRADALGPGADHRRALRIGGVRPAGDARLSRLRDFP